MCLQIFCNFFFAIVISAFENYSKNTRDGKVAARDIGRRGKSGMKRFLEIRRANLKREKKEKKEKTKSRAI